MVRCAYDEMVPITFRQFSSKFAVYIADIRIPGVSVPSVYYLRRAVGELVRGRVSGDSTVGILYTGQLCRRRRR